MSGKVTGHEQLQRIADALDDDILNASPEQLREELAAEGLDEAKVIAEMDAALAEAKKSCGKLRIQQAKAAVAARGSEASKVSPIDRERVRSKLDAMRSGADENVAGMMMAARKGKKLSDKDEEGTLDDLAQLEALENEGDDEE
jgi:uncharacterized protein YgfB (UPF0149 family)